MHWGVSRENQFPDQINCPKLSPLPRPSLKKPKMSLSLNPFKGGGRHAISSNFSFNKAIVFIRGLRRRSSELYRRFSVSCATFFSFSFLREGKGVFHPRPPTMRLKMGLLSHCCDCVGQEKKQKQQH